MQLKSFVAPPRALRPALFVLLLSLALPVTAQHNVLEDIVVTARKREETLLEAPQALSVFQDQDLRQRGITELNQIEKFAPNIVQTSFGQGNTGHAAVFMRGIGLQDHIITTDPSVGIYLDGVYLGRNMGANMDLLNIERVEVARGPQGSLSGRNTLGGSLWFSGDYRDLSGSDAAADWDGEVVSARLGADVRGSHWIAGLASWRGGLSRAVRWRWRFSWMWRMAWRLSV